MLSSAIQPSWTSDSSNENSPPLEKVMCEWVQGCDYFEKSLCSESDLVYPSIPLDELPSETTYYCDSDKLEKQFPTEEELVNGKCAVNVKGKEVYWDPFNHPTYGGYSFNNGKIYFQANLVHEKTLCSNAGEIRYRSGCAC